MVERKNPCPVEISYRGKSAYNEAVSVHRDIENILNRQIDPPSPEFDGDAILGAEEIILTVVIMSIGKAVALTLIEYLEKRLLKKKKEEDGIEFQIQIVIKNTSSDTGRRFPLILKKFQNNVLSEVFKNIRKEFF